MELLKTAVGVLIGWTTLSIAVALAWSRFMDRLRIKEAQMARAVTPEGRERDRAA